MSADKTPKAATAPTPGLEPAAVRASADEIYGRVQQLKEHL